MIRRPPGSTRTDTLCPDTTLSRSKAMLGLGYERDRWGVDAMLTTAARRNKVEYPDATAAASNPDFRAPGYGVVDLMAYWKPAAVKGLQVRAGVFKPFDKKYWEAINVPTADRKSTRLNSSHSCASRMPY